MCLLDPIFKFEVFLPESLDELTGQVLRLLFGLAEFLQFREPKLESLNFFLLLGNDVHSIIYYRSLSMVIYSKVPSKSDAVNFHTLQNSYNLVEVF